MSAGKAIAAAALGAGVAAAVAVALGQRAAEPKPGDTVYVVDGADDPREYPFSAMDGRVVADKGDTVLVSVEVGQNGWVRAFKKSSLKRREP